MPIRTAQEYFDSLKKLNQEVYLFGERLENPTEHPIIKPSTNSVAMTYYYAEKDEFKHLMEVNSHLTGETINRFTHIHHSTDDLLNKVKMQRFLGQKTGACFQRCVGMDAFNSVYSTTFEIDQKYGTEYHKRFLEFLKYVQYENIVVDGAMTDPKGDRSLRPCEQKDKDLYLRVIEKREDGIVVRGAKVHQTGIVNSHEVLVMPTIAMKEDDKDYAVSFAVPSDSKGIKIIYGRQSCDMRKMEEGVIDRGNAKFGGHEALVIFDDVFVPMNRVFMLGEYDYAGKMVERFAGFHRQSYGGCKVGVGDVLIGATALSLEYNGVEKASHVKDKLVEMVHLNETLYSSGIACSCEGKKTVAGNCEMDMMLANVCKHNVTRFPYEIARLAEDLAGGLFVTMPSESDFRNEELRPYIEKYLQSGTDAPFEDKMKVSRLIENLTLGTAAVGYKTESMHGAGSPQAQRIVIGRLANIEEKKGFAKEILDIKK